MATVHDHPTTEQTTAVRTILGDLLHMKAESITLLPSLSQQSVFLVTLEKPVDKDLLLQETRKGLSPVPKDTTQLIVRQPDPGPVIKLKVRNTVAAAILLRRILHHRSFNVVPAVYAWNDADDGQAYIVEQAMPGIKLSSVFQSLKSEQRRTILNEMARIVEAIQTAEIDNLRQYGGLRIGDDGTVVMGESAEGIGGPFAPLASFYRAKAFQQLESADASSVLQGWDENDLRTRIDEFFQTGIVEVCDLTAVKILEVDPESAPIEDEDDLEEEPTDLPRVFVHGAITFENIYVQMDEQSCKITGLLGYDNGHIGHPLEEFMSSFFDVYGFLPGPFSEDPREQLLHQAILFGHPDPLPQSKSGSLKTPKHGAEDHIDWELSKDWAMALEAANVMMPRYMIGASDLCSLYWLTQRLAPHSLIDSHLVKAQDESELLKARSEAEQILMKQLEAWEY